MKASLTAEQFLSGTVVREPVAPGNGYWAGAPGAFYAADENAWYLTYRIRRPRGVEPDRGGEARIARSTDLKNWEDIWTVRKDKYDSASIERSAVRKGADGTWRYYTSYVDPADGRWCTDIISARDPRKFDPATRKSIFKAKPLGLEGVKDPFIFEQAGKFYMFLSIALPTTKTSDKSHSTLDIYNTGECVSATGLATSNDLDNWKWEGVVLKPEGQGWDCYCRRINSIVSSNGQFVAFYDGSAGHHENYEEKTGIAVSNDLKTWNVQTPGGPRYTSPHGSKSLRYIDAHQVGGTTHLFYEMVRADAAHDLRHLTTSATLS
ncbi:MAG: hypothetical protein ACXWKG_13195 [Limisphaerales bacterium]